MKRLLPLLLAPSLLVAEELEFLYETDWDLDGTSESYYRQFLGGTDSRFWWAYWRAEGEEAPVLLPLPWVLFEADMDGEGDLDPVCRAVDPGDLYYINEQGLEVMINIPSDTLLTGVTREFDPSIPLPAVRGVKDGVARWFLQRNWKEIMPDDAYDRDGDGLNAYAELELGTTPWLSDTDGDTLPDGWEVAHGYDPLVADLDYFTELRARAFPDGEPTVAIALDRTVTVTGLYPVEGLAIVVQVSADLETWRDGGTAEDAVSGVLEFTSPLPGGFVRLAVSEE